MKCPLFQSRRLTDSGGWESTPQDCLKEECARWSKESNQCDPTGMLPLLIHIESRLSELIDKMPHEAQFRK